MYDCIIVGAGPAGSTVAYHLAKQGHTVLLLEQAVLPRYKPCSGALSPSVAQWFDFDLAPGLELTTRKLRYTWKLEDEVCAELKTQEPIWLVRRDVFDQFLVTQAQGAGAEVRDQTPVTGIALQGDHWQVHVPGETLECQYLVGADGATGPMAKWLGFPEQKLRTAAILEVDADGPVVDSFALNFEFGLAKNACIWGFPRQQGYTFGIVNFLGGKIKDLHAPLRDYAQGLGIDPAQGQEYTHLVKLWDGHQPLHCDRALLVGEAGAIVDPLTAEGIRPGVFSGVKAAAAIHQALGGEANALAQYTEIIQQEWGNDMQWAQRIASVFYRVPGIAYRVGVKRPTATERLGQLLTGDIRYGDIANRVIKRLSTGLLPGRR
ncbi:geranylgeranyl reductase family protein [Leptolyngbya sp. PCC 6406]|uniref:geranylgeranyl reductase family protein n=1 Tax=Leptolyngbya sp. PCC 6406 TaxID=1173264 RepID=UPI0002ACB29D|nr:geranylgeranyl reductase family protein [Leptolyngbya sp. PCC 6406]